MNNITKYYILIVNDKFELDNEIDKMTYYTIQNEIKLIMDNNHSINVLFFKNIEDECIIIHRELIIKSIIRIYKK